MNKQELKARADELGLTVTRADGEAGEPRVEDYERAIAEREAQMMQPPASGDGEAREFKVTGPYAVLGFKRGQKIAGAEVKRHDDTDEEIIVVGSEWALLRPLIDHGFIIEL